MAYEALIRNLWPIGLGLQAVLTVVMLRKKAWATFPFFTASTVCSFVTTLVLFLLRHSPKTYFYFFWPSEALSVVFDLCVLYEVFRHLFGAYGALRHTAAKALQCVLGVLLLIALAVLATHASSERWKVMGTMLFGLQEAVRTVQLGVVVFLFILSRIFLVHWRQPVFGIAFGLGIFAAGEIFATSSWLGAQALPLGLLSIVRMLSFDAALITWGAYMLMREDLSITSTLPPVPELERWNNLLARITYQ
jgi:hypothetical protein